MDQQKSPKKGENLRKALGLSGVAFQMGATIYAGNFLGKWLDTEYGITYLEKTTTLIAVFLSMYLVIKKVTRLNK